MRKFVLPLIASLAFATPALANEVRAEMRGGVIWINGDTEDTWGGALGYDIDVGEKAFVGAEVSGDKIGTSGTKVAWGLTGRAGIKAGDKTRLFVAGGYTTEPCDLCEGSVHAGAGIEYGLGEGAYIKSEYRHNFVGSGLPDSDAVVAGIGYRF